MRYPGQWPARGVPVNQPIDRQRTLDAIRVRGTARIPDPPRDVIAQSSSRGVLLTWNTPQINKDIVRWRIYKGDENTLYADQGDRGTRQCFVECTAATVSPTNNFFISSVNALGIESQKVQVQKAAENESGAPATASASTSQTGTDTSSGTGSISGNNKFNLT